MRGIGSREKTAVELASEVISESGGLFALHNASCNTQNTKQHEVRFRAIVGDGVREVRFECAAG